MIGGLFAGTDESPGEVIDGKKVYRGMASRDAMRSIRVDNNTMPTPEGTSTLVESKGPVESVVNDIAGGLRSALSYSNARNLKEFGYKARFGVRAR
jgi:IMP dehydrogenase